MIRTLFIISFTFFLAPIQSWAAAPKVVVDIAPLHSIVTQVMNGVGQPALLIQPEASPHSYSLRPSEAEALSQAEVVFWISDKLTPWLGSSLEHLAGSANTIEMLQLSATVRHEFRESATFETHSNNEEGDHDNHKNRKAHRHEGTDPHAWLDPMNAKVWADKIAQVLSEMDPSNAKHYRKNARVLNDSLDNLIDSLNERANRLKGINFVVFHDAYQYYERRFGLLATGAISLSDATDPSPARIREIQALVSKHGVTCAFSQPQYNSNLLDTVFEGSKVKTVGVMDPLGMGIEVGINHYSKLLDSLMTSLELCQPVPDSY